jgi:moderate conductance mechanosensitive channel
MRVSRHRASDRTTTCCLRPVATAPTTTTEPDSPLDRAAEALSDPEELLEVSGDFLLGPGGRILLILFLALFVHLGVRRAITRFVKRIAETEPGQRRSRLRKRAPSLVAESPFFAERARARAQTLAQVLRSIATAVIWSIALLTVLGEVGVDLAPLIAGAGIAGVALGFGAQSLVKDFLTGFFMLVEDQCGIGDIVDVGEAEGVVEGVSLRVTRVRDVSGTLWHVPNGQIERVANKSQEWSRALLDVAVDYSTSPDQASEVIKATADEMWRDEAWAGFILAEPEVWGVQDFGDDAMLIRLVVRTEPSEQWKVMRELRRRMWFAFQENGIEIPFPQRTVWLRPEPEPASCARSGERREDPWLRTGRHRS